MRRDNDLLLVVVVLGCLAVVLVWLVWWAGHRDDAGMAVAMTETVAEEISETSRGFDGSAPYKAAEAYNPIIDTGWPAWPSRRDIALIAWGRHLDHLAEIEASSMAIERQPSGEITVVNPPEAPVEVVPGSEIEALICSYDWDCPTALAVARCESTMQPTAVSPGGGNWGLMQINTVHRGRVAAMGFEWDQMLEAEPNLAVAYAIWSEQGWRPWSCARGHR